MPEKIINFHAKLMSKWMAKTFQIVVVPMGIQRCSHFGLAQTIVILGRQKVVKINDKWSMSGLWTNCSWFLEVLERGPKKHDFFIRLQRLPKSAKSVQGAAWGGPSGERLAKDQKDWRKIGKIDKDWLLWLVRLPLETRSKKQTHKQINKRTHK